MRRAKRTTIPLNCIDKGMFALHTKNELMLLHWMLTMAGTVEPARLRSALAAAVERYPALRGTVHNGVLSQARRMDDISGYDPLTITDLRRTHSGASVDSVHTGPLYQRLLSQWLNRPLDPAKEFPWRVLLLRSSDRLSLLVFTFHHSATDGLGALRFVRAVVERYNGAREEPPPADQRCVARGDELVAMARANRVGISHFYLKIMASLFHRFVIAPLSPKSRVCRAASRPSPGVYFCQGTLNPYELRHIRSRARTAPATVNDILLAAGFKTIDQWNAVHGRSSGKIVIMVPVDLGRGTSSPTGGNRVSFISVSTARRERANLEELLGTVHQRTSDMLSNGLAFSIVYAVHFCCCFPPQVPKAVARLLLSTRVYLDSMLVTNLGEINLGGSSRAEASKLANARISSVVVLPPVVSAMGISLSAGTHNGHLHVALAYKTSHFSHAEARLFLNLFLHELRSYQRTTEGTPAAAVKERVTRETALATRRW